MQPHPHLIRENVIEDSPLVTIEYLRAGLLAERSVSKAAIERGFELAKRIKELEEQLKAVTLQRKRAEKLTQDALSYLESHGVSDISEVYESYSDQEESSFESNMVKSTKDENFRSLEQEEIDRESSRSDHESTPSSGGSLAWKGRKKTTQPHEKKHLESPTPRHSTFTLVNTSPRHRLGKSCRQVKRREMRSAVEESRHDSRKSDTQISNSLESLDQGSNCMESGGDQFENIWVERDCRMVEVPVSFQHQAHDYDTSSSNSRHRFDKEMERTLEDQAQLKTFYKAQEKAQRDWEENYAEANISMADSREDYNHLGRDENKVAVSHSVEIANCHGVESGTETISQSKQQSITDFNSLKPSTHADTERSDNHNSSQMQSCKSPSRESAFPVMNTILRLGHTEGQSPHSCGRNAFDPYSMNFSKEHVHVPHEEPHMPEEVLSALQLAKLLIRQGMSNLPKTCESVTLVIENPTSSGRDVDCLKGPVEVSGLFRVPIDLQSEVASQSRSLVLDDSLQLLNSNIHAKAPCFTHQYIPRPMDLGPCTLADVTVPINPVYQAGLGISARPRVEIYSSTGAVLPGKNA